MYATVPWIVSLIATLAAAGFGVAWLRVRKKRSDGKPLPNEWTLTARPVFNADERRVYRLLKDSLPHHVILAKLPLVRFCQPTEAKDVHYWYDLLGATHVNFAICSPNGRVLAAVDLDTERNGVGRSLQIKQAVLSACRVRYLRCPVDKLPSAAELQLLVPFNSNNQRGPQPAPMPSPVAPRPGLNSAPRRASRASLWQDSAVFQDSFFAPDPRWDNSKHLSRAASQHLGEPIFGESQYPDEAPNDIVGVVVDSPRYSRI